MTEIMANPERGYVVETFSDTTVASKEYSDPNLLQGCTERDQSIISEVVYQQPKHATRAASNLAP